MYRCIVAALLIYFSLHMSFRTRSVQTPHYPVSEMDKKGTPVYKQEIEPVSCIFMANVFMTKMFSTKHVVFLSTLLIRK